MSHPRIAFFDTAKGLCIMLVVLFHMQEAIPLDSRIQAFLSMVRMPLYFVLSGVFLKPYNGYGEFLTRKVNKLLIPFGFFYLTTSVVLPALLQATTGYTFDHYNGLATLWAFVWPEHFPNQPIWFLWALFCAVAVYYPIMLSTRGRQGLAMGMALLVGLGICLMPWDLPAFLDNALRSLPFIGFGAMLRQPLQRLQQASPRQRLLLLIASLTVTVACTYAYRHTTCDLLLAAIHYTAGCSGSLMVLALSALVGSIPGVSYFGRYSIMILVTHNLCIRLMTGLLAALGWPTPVAIPTLLAGVYGAFFAIIPLLRRFLPHVTAQKDLIPIKQ